MNSYEYEGGYDNKQDNSTEKFNDSTFRHMQSKMKSNLTVQPSTLYPSVSVMRKNTDYTLDNFASCCSEGFDTGSTKRNFKI